VQNEPAFKPKTKNKKPKNMKTTAKFYHAGCPVCVSAESSLVNALDSEKVDLEIIHLGDQKDRIPEAREAGVKSVPALVLGGEALHINFGASLSALQ
jgi:glutaredoxin